MAIMRTRAQLKFFLFNRILLLKKCLGFYHLFLLVHLRVFPTYIIVKQFLLNYLLPQGTILLPKI
jgi:hypothetical protein